MIKLILVAAFMWLCSLPFNVLMFDYILSDGKSKYIDKKGFRGFVISYVISFVIVIGVLTLK